MNGTKDAMIYRSVGSVKQHNTPVMSCLLNSCVHNVPDDVRLMWFTSLADKTSNLTLFQTKHRDKLRQLAFKPTCFVPMERMCHLELKSVESNHGIALVNAVLRSMIG